jgi:CBS domain-containing protein
VGKGSISREEAIALRVGEVMLANPKTLRSDAQVGEVRRLFAKPNVRTVLLADDGAFRGAIERENIPVGAPDDAAAVAFADPEPVIVSPEMPMTDAVALLERRGEPRLVVLDEDGVTLRGLICTNTTATGFCVR